MKTSNQKSQGTPLRSDPWIYRIVVSSLSLTMIACVAGAIFLQLNGQSIPDLITAIGSGSLGALAGLLANRQPSVRVDY